MRSCLVLMAACLLIPNIAVADDVVSMGLEPGFERAELESATPNSISCGSANRGALSDASRLPTEGPGFVMAEPWKSRDARYGTRELVQLVEQAAATVAEQHPGSQLSVGDLSKEAGGPIASHRSHQNGRDVDLIYYAIDAEGRPFFPDNHMGYFDSKGKATYAKAPSFAKNIPERYFDLERNWSLVEALIGDESSRVERIFVSGRVKRWLLRYAAEIEVDEDTLKKAQRILHRPRDSRGHNDHMHLRITCSDDDVAAGRCRDSAAPKPKRARRWHRKVKCPREAEAPLLPGLPALVTEKPKTIRAKQAIKKAAQIKLPPL